MTLSELELGQQMAWKKEGYSERQWNEYKGKKPDTRGAKNLFSEDNIVKIQKRIRSIRTTTAVDIARSAALNPNNASLRCVQKLLNSIGLKCHVAPSKPMLSDLNTERRIEFAENLVDWTQEDLETILFTDESKLYCKKNGKHLVRVNDGFKMPNKLFIKTQKNNRGKEIMVWGAMNSRGPMYLFLVEETLGGKKYRKLLIDFLKNSDYDVETKIFQQDNCKVHKSKIVTKYYPFQTKGNRIKFTCGQSKIKNKMMNSYSPFKGLQNDISSIKITL